MKGGHSDLAGTKDLCSGFNSIICAPWTRNVAARGAFLQAPGPMQKRDFSNEMTAEAMTHPTA
jgi:hypothetical protein